MLMKNHLLLNHSRVHPAPERHSECSEAQQAHGLQAWPLLGQGCHQAEPAHSQPSKARQLGDLPVSLSSRAQPRLSAGHLCCIAVTRELTMPQRCARCLRRGAAPSGDTLLHPGTATPSSIVGSVVLCWSLPLPEGSQPPRCCLANPTGSLECFLQGQAWQTQYTHSKTKDKENVTFL